MSDQILLSQGYELQVGQDSLWMNLLIARLGDILSISEGDLPGTRGWSNEPWYEGAPSFTYSDLKAVTIHDEGLTFNFQPYVTGCWACGWPERKSSAHPGLHGVHKPLSRSIDGLPGTWLDMAGWTDPAGAIDHQSIDKEAGRPIYWADAVGRQVWRERPSTTLRGRTLAMALAAGSFGRNTISAWAASSQARCTA